MNEQISFRRLKTAIKTKGLSVKDVAERCGMAPNNLSHICNDTRTPVTDVVAKICSVLECYPSEVLSFDGIDVKDVFADSKREPLPEKFTGEVTYKPMWRFLDDYIAEWNKAHPEEKKNANDLFDGIEPPRRIAGYKVPEGFKGQKGVEARFGEGYKSENPRKKSYTEGLPGVTRVKLRNDRPLNLSVIYEICKKLGCTIDFVMGYK